jgi:MinD-like ATPase involved in chromosome partitioning or flagellar assembly
MLKVSFYSYKGGAGRSTTSWNTIQSLVALCKPTEKEPFVIVDTDTESAGSTFLYKAKDVFFKDEQCHSVQKRMTDSEETNYSEASDSEKEEFFNGMHPIGTFFGLPEAEEKAVLLIGANLHKDSAREADVFGAGGKDSEQMKNFRKNIAGACKDCGAKALFFDTPSGTQFLADRSIEQSEIVVCCMRPTSQFREGTRGRLIYLIKNDLKNKMLGKRKYILTPTVVCVDAGQKFFLDGEEYVYPSRAKEVIIRELGSESIDESDEIKQAYKENVILDMLEPTPASIKEKTGYDVKDDNELVFGIPEIKRFKWFEACLGKILADGGKLTPNDEMAVNRYEYLAQTILKNRKN